MAATVAWWPELSSDESCDRCGARARVQAVLPSGPVLLLCGHHGRLYEEKLREIAVVLRWSP